MRMIDIIEKKRDGFELTEEELFFFIDNYVKDKIPSYQVSALLMAIYFKGMTFNETRTLTKLMLESGDQIDLTKIEGVKVDKHSTGGVGDKTSLVVGPICAACGLKVAKISGRGLGHTGGTLDKLESIPGFNISVNDEDFIKQVNEINLAIVGQTKQLVPADKKLYALRDVTGTVPAIPLIASSIMSKKIAGGADIIFLDVKVGSGAFMKTVKQATELSKLMIKIGESFGKKVSIAITNMDQPLGNAVGNSLEVVEAIDTLNGHGPKDFTELCYKTCSHMLVQSGLVEDSKEALKLIKNSIKSKKALQKFVEMTNYQGGDSSYILNPSKFEKAKYIYEVRASKSGYVKHIDALQIGEYAMKLGAGRAVIEDKIDNASGIVLNKKVSDKVDSGEVLCTIYTNKENYLEIIEGLEEQFVISSEQIKKPKLIISVID